MNVIDFKAFKTQKKVNEFLTKRYQHHKNVIELITRVRCAHFSNQNYHKGFLNHLNTAYKTYLKEFTDKYWLSSINSTFRTIKKEGQSLNELFKTQFKIFNAVPSLLGNKKPFEEDNLIFKLETDLIEKEKPETIYSVALFHQVMDDYIKTHFKEENKRFIKQTLLAHYIFTVLNDQYPIVDINTDQGLLCTYFDEKNGLLISSTFDVEPIIREIPKYRKTNVS